MMQNVNEPQSSQSELTQDETKSDLTTDKTNKEETSENKNTQSTAEVMPSLEELLKKG